MSSIADSAPLSMALAGHFLCHVSVASHRSSSADATSNRLADGIMAPDFERARGHVDEAPRSRRWRRWHADP
jgi:hypothetical protein